MRRFICIHGTPSHVVSDRGTQLVQAASEMTCWNFSTIREWCQGKKFTWEFVPKGASHMNGLAERLIGIVKKTLVNVLANKRCSFNELSTILYETALIVNSRPVGVKARSEEVEAGGPITPLHLLLGRATAEAPKIVSTRVGLMERLEFVDEVKRSFWKKWIAIVYQGLDRTYKWRKGERDLRPGDVVLLKDETRAYESYRLAKVDMVHPSAADGRVRRVRVAYKNPGEKDYRYSERPVHKLVLIVPMEEQEAGPPTLEFHDELEDDELPLPAAEGMLPEAVPDAATEEEEEEQDPEHSAKAADQTPWAGRLRNPDERRLPTKLL